ncbi:electron transfer flavoprotein subunit alpha/FixB family protein [Capnocytophaga cynodegmi]|uniref:electron transfer flavoprotein subunit alpha/FixB family protein n=1 Tax=Capnocytophaga cynodegmi TaxID=28189 RepID=UPI001EE33E90|nr:electron transfer flavoprotein subunit alpha/FixB family protein [Capnocytophaga cynodegmi]GJQ07800.1 electron transfer flavoprotein subunit alpha [Capnocytophaga cynodegmi]
MSILIYADSENGKLKKSAFEVASYAKAIADKQDTSVTAVVVNTNDVALLGNYGVDKVIRIKDEKLNHFSSKTYSSVLKQVAEKENSQIIVLSSSSNSKSIAPFLAVTLQAGYISNVISLPEDIDNFIVRSNIFSNKAIGATKITTTKKVISLAGNAYGLKESPVTISVEDFSPSLTENDFNITINGVEKNSGKVSLDDASIVVSGGRGLKGPENWGMIEELAEVLGAATACSKPVADMDWRPHGEHVGQTGKPIAANLYIAIGISGAIQHLAGVNASKVKVVINTDENAPFFKAADYGIVGDAFEVVPKLIQKLKAFKEE